MCKRNYQNRSIQLFIYVLATLSLFACNEPSPSNSNKQYLAVEVKAQKTTSVEESFPVEIDRISVEVVNDQDEVIASSSTADNSASFNLSVPRDTPLSVIAYAYSGNELLYKGVDKLDPLTLNSQTTVEITLQSQVTVLAPPDPQTVTDSGAIELSPLIDVRGLNDSSLAYAINGVEGGNETLGLISTYGTYTPPPHLLETLQVQLSATPIAAPSFAEIIEVVIEPTPIDLNWFTDEGLRSCVDQHEAELVAALTTLDCSHRTTGLNILSMQGLENLTALKELNISNQYIESIPPLGSLTLLNKLTLSLNLLGDIKGLESLPSLQSLDLSWNPGFYSLDGDNPLDPLIPLAALTSLKELDLSCVFNMTENSVSALRKKLPNTEILFKCSYLYPETISIQANEYFDFKGFISTTVLSDITNKLELLSSDKKIAAQIDSNDSDVIYSVDEIVGGNEKIGTISKTGKDAGIFFSPRVNSNQIVTLSASLEEAPTFKVELNIEIKPIINPLSTY